MDEDVNKKFPYWVEIYYDGANTFWQSRGATDVTRTGPGNYAVTWGKNISGCAQNVQVANYGMFDPPNRYGKAETRYGGSNTTTIYRTWNTDPKMADWTDSDYPIAAQLTCGTQTGTNQS